MLLGVCVRVFHVCVSVCQTKLSRLCEQDKAVRTQEEKLQQLHREKVRPPLGHVTSLTATRAKASVCVRVCSTRWRRPCCRPVRS